MKRYIKTKKIAGMVLAATLVMASLTGCGGEKAAVDVPELIEPVGVDVDIVKVKKMDLSSVSSFQGQIVPEIINLYFVNSGVIGNMNVTVGDKVKKGQLLASLTSADGSVKELKEQLAQKKLEDKDSNEISECDIQRLQEELSQLKAQKANKAQITEKKESIKIAKLALKHQKEQQQLNYKHLQEDIAEAVRQTKESKIYAPVDGEIISTTGGSGYMVQGGMPALSIADMSKPRIQTEYIGNSILGKASAYMAVVNGKKYAIEVEEQEVSQFDIEMGIYPPNTWFNFTEKASLPIGESATIDLYTDTAKDALVIPSNSLYRVKGETYVYRMDGNVKKKASVTVGTSTDAYVQILTGLKEGDEVYVQN